MRTFCARARGWSRAPPDVRAVLRRRLVDRHARRRARRAVPACRAPTRHDAEWRLEWSGLDGRREGFSSQAYAGGSAWRDAGTRPAIAASWAWRSAADATRCASAGRATACPEFGTRRGDHHFGAVAPGRVAVARRRSRSRVRAQAYGARSREWTTGRAAPVAFDRAYAHARGTRLHADRRPPAREGEPRAWAHARVGVECEPVSGLALAVATRGHDEWRVGVTLRGLRGATTHSTAMRDGDKTNERWAVSAHSGEERTPSRRAATAASRTMRAGGILADEAAAARCSATDVTTVGNRSVAAQLDRALEKDPLTRGVLLDLQGVAGMAQLEELRRASRSCATRASPWSRRSNRAAAAATHLASAMHARTRRRRRRSSPGSACAPSAATTAEMLERYGVRMDRAERRRVQVGVPQLQRGPHAGAGLDQDPAHARPASGAVPSFRRGVAARSSASASRTSSTVRSWTSADLVDAGLLDGVAYRDDAWHEVGKLSGLGEARASCDARASNRRVVAWTQRSPIAVVTRQAASRKGAAAAGS